MELEKLKLIAEGMGYELHYSEIGQVCTVDSAGLWIKKPSDDTHKNFTNCYNPLTNNDQMVEIMEKLISAGHILCDSSAGYSIEFWNHEECLMRYSGKIINEAVCNAAYEYFKGDK